jgi:hypothetical protein
MQGKSSGQTPDSISQPEMGLGQYKSLIRAVIENNLYEKNDFSDSC